MAQTEQSGAPIPPSGGGGEPRPGRVSRGVFWVLVVLGAFIALGLLWFALLGNPHVIGSDSGAGSSSGASSTASGARTSGSVTVADIRSVIARVDYAESSDASSTEYNHMFTHVLEGVDILAFAQSTLDATSGVWWIDPATGGNRHVFGAEKDAIVAQAIATVRDLEVSEGASSTLNALLSIALNPPTIANRQREDSLLGVADQGLAPLGLMFGAHDVDNDWTWRVTQIAVTGPDSARVTYSASASPRANWRFVDPSASYVKHLTFTRGAGGVWRLAGWSNYSEVLSQFRANITPPGTATAVDEWWGAL